MWSEYGDHGEIKLANRLPMALSGRRDVWGVSF